jgi:SAM-dependent methyltransferase
LRDNRFGLPHSIRIGWCPACGLGVTLEPPSQAELDSLYASEYAAPDESPPQVPGTSLTARAWHRVNGSLPLGDEHIQGPVLDVGCNRGEVLVVLRERGLDVMGLEPNHAAADAARAQGLHVLEQPIEGAELPDQRFRSVLLSQVLEHVHEPQAVLERVRPSLRKDGRLYVVVPNAASVWRYIFGPDWVHWHVPFHLTHHTHRSLALLLAQAGFAVERMCTITPGEWLLMHLEARSNRRRDVYRLQPFRGRYGRRLLLAPAGRLGDAFGRGDALYAIARPA